MEHGASAGGGERRVGSHFSVGVQQIRARRGGAVAQQARRLVERALGLGLGLADALAAWAWLGAALRGPLVAGCADDGARAAQLRGQLCASVKRR